MKYLWMVLWIACCVGLRTEAGTLVQFRTSAGNVTAELLDAEKPITVTNFLRYVRQVYPTNAVFFHRCLPDFILQGGGYRVASSNQVSSEDFTEWYRIDRLPPITNEFRVGPKVSNTFGTIAMALADDNPNSATSEWFFNLADNSSNLDVQNGGFTVFGKVVDGTNVLQYFNTLSKVVVAGFCGFYGIVDMRCYYGNTSAARLFSDLPVSYSGTVYPRYSDFFYVKIDLLLELRPRLQPDGRIELRWIGPKGRQQVVESTTSLPGSWQSVGRSLGTGEEQSLVDPNGAAGSKFYRIRLE